MCPGPAPRPPHVLLTRCVHSIAYRSVRAAAWSEPGPRCRGPSGSVGVRGRRERHGMSDRRVRNRPRSRADGGGVASADEKDAPWRGKRLPQLIQVWSRTAFAAAYVGPGLFPAVVTGARAVYCRGPGENGCAVRNARCAENVTHVDVNGHMRHRTAGSDGRRGRERRRPRPPGPASRPAGVTAHREGVITHFGGISVKPALSLRRADSGPSRRPTPPSRPLPSAGSAAAPGIPVRRRLLYDVLSGSDRGGPRAGDRPVNAPGDRRRRTWSPACPQRCVPARRPVGAH